MTSTLWYVRTDSLGVDEAIGKRLVQSFWNILPEKLNSPATFAFLNRVVLVFASTHAAMAAEDALREAGIGLQVIPLPAWVAADCGLALRLDGTDAGRGRRSFFAARSRSGAL